MLIERTWKKDDIITMKLVTGEEVIAKLVEQDRDSIQVSKPMVLTLGVDPSNNQYQLQMLPTFLFSMKPDAKLTIELRHVVTITVSEDNARNSYITNTTGLTVPGTPQPGAGQKMDDTLTPATMSWIDGTGCSQCGKPLQGMLHEFSGGGRYWAYRAPLYHNAKLNAGFCGTQCSTEWSVQLYRSKVDQEDE